MKVNLIFSKKDLYINFDKKTDMIIVTGMSGSGKSQLAISLKEKYGYEIISFDMIVDYDENRELSLIEKDILTKFRRCYPKYKVAHLIENDENVCDCFYNFVKKYIKKEKIKIIFDGSYFMKRVNFELFKNERIVYKRTSFLKALFRRDVRNISRIKNKNYSFIRFLKEIYWHYRYNIKHLKKWYKEERSFLQKIDNLYV